MCVRLSTKFFWETFSPFSTVAVKMIANSHYLLIFDQGWPNNSRNFQSLFKNCTLLNEKTYWETFPIYRVFFPRHSSLRLCWWSKRSRRTQMFILWVVFDTRKILELPGVQRWHRRIMDCHWEKLRNSNISEHMWSSYPRHEICLSRALTTLIFIQNQWFGYWLSLKIDFLYDNVDTIFKNFPFRYFFS